MATDNKPTGDIETPPPMVDDPFPSIADRLAGILDAATDVGMEVVGPLSTAAGTASNGVSQTPKMRIRTLILSTDIACILTLVFGTRRYPFALVPGCIDIPFPFVIERGQNVSIETSVAVTAHAYLIVQPE